MPNELSELQLSKLFNERRDLPLRQSETFLKMAGFPYRENVWSNILNFYFQSTNGHGLGNAVFRAFMALIDVDISPDIVKASREEIIEGGKRLDIVLETSDMVIGIENKVKHELDNPLDEYRKHLDELAKGREVHSFVLSLHQVPADQRQRWAKWHFVTYNSFAKKLRQDKYIDFSPAQFGNKYVMFLEDFITTADQGEYMDPKRLKFFTQHRVDIEMLSNEVVALKEDMRRKVKALWAAIQVDILANQWVADSGLLPADEGLKDLIWNRVDIAPDFALTVDIVLEPDGWKILFYNYPDHRSRVEQWIKQRGIPYHIIYQTTPIPWRLLIDDPTAPAYDEEIELVSRWALEWLSKVVS